MTVTCPSGHASATADYCDQCGVPIAAVMAPQQPTVELPVLDEIETSPSEVREPCPVCGAPRSGDDRYCEGCGHDFLASPRAASGWEAVVSADRAQFERLRPDAVVFPVDYRERRFALNGEAMRIGRRRGRADEPPLEIDLAGVPEDPGISRVHAVLERRADGGYAIRDLRSTNGTTVNDDQTALDPDTAVPLADGDRIRIGAWTTITVRSR
ncbi:MAG: FHA domain-containing protein [Solirubrobacteraceae bacterium]